MKDYLCGLLFRLFIHIGTKFFPVVATYNPNPSNDESRLKAVHFAVNDYHLEASVLALAADFAEREMKEESDEQP